MSNSQGRQSTNGLIKGSVMLSVPLYTHTLQVTQFETKHLNKSKKASLGIIGSSTPDRQPNEIKINMVRVKAKSSKKIIEYKVIRIAAERWERAAGGAQRGVGGVDTQRERGRERLGPQRSVFCLLVGGGFPTRYLELLFAPGSSPWKVDVVVIFGGFGVVARHEDFAADFVKSINTAEGGISSPVRKRWEEDVDSTRTLVVVKNATRNCGRVSCPLQSPPTSGSGPSWLDGAPRSILWLVARRANSVLTIRSAWSTSCCLVSVCHLYLKHTHVKRFWNDCVVEAFIYLLLIDLYV